MIELEFESNLMCDLEFTENIEEENSTIPYLEEPVEYQHFFRAHLVRWKYHIYCSVHLGPCTWLVLSLDCSVHLTVLCTWLVLVELSPE